MSPPPPQDERDPSSRSASRWRATRSSGSGAEGDGESQVPSGSLLSCGSAARSLPGSVPLHPSGLLTWTVTQARLAVAHRACSEGRSGYQAPSRVPWRAVTLATPTRSGSSPPGICIGSGLGPQPGTAVTRVSLYRSRRSPRRAPVGLGARRRPGAEPLDHPVVHREGGRDEHRELDVGVGRTGRCAAATSPRSARGAHRGRCVRCAGGPASCRRNPRMTDLSASISGAQLGGAVLLEQRGREGPVRIHAEEAVVRGRDGGGEHLVLVAPDLAPGKSWTSSSSASPRRWTPGQASADRGADPGTSGNPPTIGSSRERSSRSASRVIYSSSVICLEARPKYAARPRTQVAGNPCRGDSR